MQHEKKESMFVAYLGTQLEIDGKFVIYEKLGHCSLFVKSISLDVSFVISVNDVTCEINEIEQPYWE